MGQRPARSTHRVVADYDGDVNSQSLTTHLIEEARRLGFQLAGACPAATATGYHRFLQWLELGYGGRMDYLANRAAAYEHPRGVLPGVRSLLMLGMSYATASRRPPATGQASIASYAWGDVDYHDLIHARLRRLRATLQALRPTAQARGVVDTAPLLEREFAQLAGLGWAGKNTLLLNKELGSYFFLAALLTDQELAYDQPFAADHCGACRACLDACPTDAFPEPYVLDASRCISYLTIELRDAVPEPLAGKWDEWLFGCDVCQEVCPWNHRTPDAEEPEFQPRYDANPVDLSELFYLSDAEFRSRFRRTPLWRARRRGVLRNAALVLGAQRDRQSIAAHTHGSRDHEPLVRDACRWALRQME